MTDNTADAAGVAAQAADAIRDALALVRYARAHDIDSTRKILAAIKDKETADPVLGVLVGMVMVGTPPDFDDRVLAELNGQDGSGELEAKFADAWRDALALVRYYRAHDSDSAQEIVAAIEDKGTTNKVLGALVAMVTAGTPPDFEDRVLAGLNGQDGSGELEAYVRDGLE
jgi:hypothetical protein